MAEALSRILTREEATLAHLRSVQHSWLTEAVRRWPDLRFTAADGREFCLAINGKSIGYRILAIDATSLTQADWKRLRGVVAVIVESPHDPFDPSAPSEFDPLVYHDAGEAFEAWRELQVASGKKIDEAAGERLAAELGLDEDEDD